MNPYSFIPVEDPLLNGSLVAVFNRMPTASVSSVSSQARRTTAIAGMSIALAV
jgi:hypothetical protein